MRTALVVLIVTLCASGAMAQPTPADVVPFDHWAYDAAAVLGDALGDAWPYRLPPDRGMTRYEFAMATSRALSLLPDSDITAEQAQAGHLGEVWRRLTQEFLPEVSDLCEDTVYMLRELYDGTPPPPAPRLTESSLGVVATDMLRGMPADHWLYPEVQRLIWADPELKRTAPPGASTPADTLAPQHWTYQAMFRVAPLVFRNERQRNMHVGRAVTRYEFAMLAWMLFGVLSAAEEPVQEPEAAEVTWALLAVEFWRELGDMELTDDVERIPEDHWLHETGQRVLEIVEGNHREGA